MIIVVSGALGTGKSLTSTILGNQHLENGNNLITNYEIFEDKLTYPRSYYKGTNKSNSQYRYFDEDNFTIENLVKFCFKYNYIFDQEKKKKYSNEFLENQTMLIIDEADLFLSNREWSIEGRKQWLHFFKHSRKLGLKILLISQSIEMVDKHLRFFVGKLYKLVTPNNFKAIGKFMTMIGIRIFVVNKHDYSMQAREGTQVILLKKKYQNMYDSHKVFGNYDFLDELLMNTNIKVSGDTADIGIESQSPEGGQVNVTPAESPTSGKKLFVSQYTKKREVKNVQDKRMFLLQDIQLFRKRKMLAVSPSTKSKSTRRY